MILEWNGCHGNRWCSCMLEWRWECLLPLLFKVTLLHAMQLKFGFTDMVMYLLNFVFVLNIRMNVENYLIVNY